MKAISKQGLPLKITTEWTDNDYWERRNPDLDDMECVNVAGWQVRINGLKFPRGHTDGDGRPDWTYRYTRHGKTEEGKKFAIEQAMISGGFNEPA
tara:strand:+ start:488 stop:772 length:285 start_codon:yes stop_codon:yes gene_type:complete